jgi:glutathione S-transferase
LANPPPATRYRTIEWLMWQMGGPGPMFGQVHHFVKYNKGKAPYAEECHAAQRAVDGSALRDCNSVDHYGGSGNDLNWRLT